MRRTMFIGKSGCGKTSLCQAIEGEGMSYKKTQSIEVGRDTIDTPGEYLENRGLYKALVVSACDAELLVFVQAADDPYTSFSPGQAAMFAQPVAGVVSKADLSPEGVAVAAELLRLAGASPVVVTSAAAGDGIAELIELMSRED